MAKSQKKSQQIAVIEAEVVNVPAPVQATTTAAEWEQVLEAEEVPSPSTMWVIRVRGDGCGRSRYVRHDGRLTPWKFQAAQCNDRQMAEKILKLDVAPQLQPGMVADVQPFPKAWYEDVG
jgi:hypothetical protein